MRCSFPSFLKFFSPKFQNFMFNLNHMDIRIISKLLIKPVKYVLRTHSVFFCVIFQRRNISTVNFNFMGGKVDSQVNDPVPVEGLKLSCCVLGKNSAEISSPRQLFAYAFRFFQSLQFSSW